jgi:hypothetical protein
MWVPADGPEIQIHANGTALETTNDGDTAIENMEGPAPDTNRSGLSINVYARFRPFVSNAGGGGGKEVSKVILPLHQKIAMIRQKAQIDSNSNGTSISNKEAFTRLMTEMGERGVGMGVNLGKEGGNDDIVVLEGKRADVAPPGAGQGFPDNAVIQIQNAGHGADFGVQTGILSVNKNTNSVLTAAAGVGILAPTPNL